MQAGRLVERRQIGQRRERPAVELGERAQIARLDQRQLRRRPVEHEIDALGQNAVRHFRAAVIGHEQGVDAGRVVEQITLQFCRDGAGAVIELAGRGLGLGDQILHRFQIALRIDHKETDGLRHQRDRREIGDRIVRQAFVEILVHHQRRIDRHQQRVAIGRSLGSSLRADHRIGPRPVLDHHRLLEIDAHLVADEPRQHVGWAAGGEGDDDVDGAGGVVLRGRLRGTKRRYQHQYGEAKRAHGVLPVRPSLSQSSLSQSSTRRAQYFKSAPLAAGRG